MGVDISDRSKGISLEKSRELTGARAGVGVRPLKKIEEMDRQLGGTQEIAPRFQRVGARKGWPQA